MSWTDAIEEIRSLSKEFHTGGIVEFAPALDRTATQALLQSLRGNEVSLDDRDAFQIVAHSSEIHILLTHILQDSSDDEFSDVVQFSGLDRLTTALSGGQSVLLLGSHVGLYWLGIAAIVRQNLPVTALVENHMIANFSGNYENIKRDVSFPAGSYLKLDRALRGDPRVVHILPDVWSGTGRLVDILGRKHHVAEGFCALAHKHKPVLLTISVDLSIDGKLHVTFADHLGDVPSTMSRGDLTDHLISRYAGFLEGRWAQYPTAINQKMIAQLLDEDENIYVSQYRRELLT